MQDKPLSYFLWQINHEWIVRIWRNNAFQKSSKTIRKAEFELQTKHCISRWIHAWNAIYLRRRQHSSLSEGKYHSIKPKVFLLQKLFIPKVLLVRYESTASRKSTPAFLKYFFASGKIAPLQIRLHICFLSNISREHEIRITCDGVRICFFS